MKIGPCVGGIEEGQTTKERRELNHYYYSTPPSVVGRLMMDKIRGVEEMGELYSFLCLKSRHELKTHYCNEQINKHIPPMKSETIYADGMSHRRVCTSLCRVFARSNIRRRWTKRCNRFVNFYMRNERRQAGQKRRAALKKVGPQKNEENSTTTRPPLQGWDG